MYLVATFAINNFTFVVRSACSKLFYYYYSGAWFLFAKVKGYATNEVFHAVIELSGDDVGHMSNIITKK